MSNIPPPPLSDRDSSVQSRLRFDISEFDQVIAINQSAINAALHANWTQEKLELELVQTDEEDVTKTWVSASLKGTMLPPTIELSAPSDDLSGWFYMNFGTDAKIGVSVISGGTLQLKWYDVPKWTLAWKVDFSEQTIDALPEAQRLIVKDLRDYTPRHVFINFSNSNLLHPDDSKSYTPMPSDLDPAKPKDDARCKLIRTNLASLVENHIRKQVDAGKNILGYAVTASTLDTSLVPTLTATDVAFQNYPYYNKGQVNAKELYTPWSAFCFLNTLAPNKTFPSNQALAINKIVYSGNLVTPFPPANAQDPPQMAGSLFIKRDCFMPTLSEVFKTVADDMFLMPDWVSFKSESTIGKCTQDFQVKRGQGSLRLDHKQVGDSLTWETEQYERKISGYDERGLDGCLGANEGNLFTNGYNSYSINRGDGFIQVKGWSTYRFEWHTRIAATWWNQNGWPWVKSGWDWDFRIHFTVNKDGRLGLEVNEKDFNVTVRDLNKYGTIGYFMEDINKMTLLGTPLTVDQAKQSISSMNDAFKTAGIYVLPAAGQYQFFDPQFSARGDLMVGMSLETGHSGINGN